MSEQDSQGLSRRQMLGAAGLLAGAMAVGAGAADTAMAADLRPFRPRGALKRRPNFLVVIMDEQRHPVMYESDRLKAWRRANLHSQNFLRTHAMDFQNHHIMSSACAPSRASFFTGQYPSLHGVTQTSGMAKSAIETDLYWLDPTSVPTMGSWFRAGGYDTYYKGKWHVSDADLYQPGTYNPLPSYTDAGLPDPDLEQVYLEADRLSLYGFEGWIGPEPHGSNPLNSGSSGPHGRGRDAMFAGQGVKLLEQLRNNPNPWLVVTSFVNPHDIVLWGSLSLAMQNFYLAQQLIGSNVPDDLFTSAYEVSSSEDLATKPSAQGSYKEVYPIAQQPTNNNLAYHRFYYQLQKNVDVQIGRVLRALRGSRSEYRDTIILYFSDHGELLGSHGGLFQKWHNAYDEVLRVPLMIHNPELFPKAQTSQVLTSHADVIPTMLGLAGLDESVLADRLRETHTQVRKLPGRDLSGYLLGEVDEQDVRQVPQFFMTDDEPMRGDEQISWYGTMYNPVIQPNHLETVIAMLPTGDGGSLERWKYTRYWDNPAFWSNPGVMDVQTIIKGVLDDAGNKVAVTTVKYANPQDGQEGPAPDQIEVYNVTQDPTELTNLADDAASARVVALLQDLLNEQISKKRLSPTMQPWADGSPGRFVWSGSQ